MISPIIGHQVIIQGAPWVVTYAHEGKQRISLEPLPTKPPTKDQRGRFVDHEWINTDPVWVLYDSVDGWECTDRPQTVVGYAYGDRIGVVGDEPILYGIYFAERANMFPTREAAHAECERRNSARASA